MEVVDFKCTACGAAFESSSARAQHTRAKHRCICKVCGSSFYSSAALTQHSKAVHEQQSAHAVEQQQSADEEKRKKVFAAKPTVVDASKRLPSATGKFKPKNESKKKKEEPKKGYTGGKISYPGGQSEQQQQQHQQQPSDLMRQQQAHFSQTTIGTGKTAIDDASKLHSNRSIYAPPQVGLPSSNGGKVNHDKFWIKICTECGRVDSDDGCAYHMTSITYRHEQDIDRRGLIFPLMEELEMRHVLLGCLCAVVKDLPKNDASRIFHLVNAALSDEHRFWLQNWRISSAALLLEFLGIAPNSREGPTVFMHRAFKEGTIRDEWKTFIALPEAYFPGRIRFARTAEQGAHFLRQFLRDNENAQFFGVDCEWKPEMGRVDNPIELIQIATEHECLLLRVGLWNRPTSELQSFFRGKRVKLMKGPSKDILKLKAFGIDEMAEIIDLEKHEKLSGSMKKAVAAVLGWRLNKAQTRSNWASKRYTEEQIRYAATDAWMNVVLWKKVNEV